MVTLAFNLVWHCGDHNALNLLACVTSTSCIVTNYISWFCRKIPLADSRHSNGYEAKFIYSLSGIETISTSVQFTYRYINDVNLYFEIDVDQMYPVELEIKDVTESKHFCF